MSDIQKLGDIERALTRKARIETIKAVRKLREGEYLCWFDPRGGDPGESPWDPGSAVVVKSRRDEAEDAAERFVRMCRNRDDEEVVVVVADRHGVVSFFTVEIEVTVDVTAYDTDETMDLNKEDEDP